LVPATVIDLHRDTGNGHRFAFSALQKIIVATSVCTGGSRCPPDICI